MRKVGKVYGAMKDINSAKSSQGRVGAFRRQVSVSVQKVTRKGLQALRSDILLPFPTEEFFRVSDGMNVDVRMNSNRSYQA